jgi:hypothetical protein
LSRINELETLMSAVTEQHKMVRQKHVNEWEAENLVSILLITFSEVRYLLKLCKNGLSQHMNCNNILAPEHFRLKKDTSTEDAANN